MDATNERVLKRPTSSFGYTAEISFDRMLLTLASSVLMLPGVLLGAYALYRSERNPYTGSRDWPMASPAWEMQDDMFDRFTEEHKRDVLHTKNYLVIRANRIFEEAVRDIKSTGRRDLCQFKWELKILKRTSSACFRAGKIILEKEDADVDEHELAYALCHELGHAIARHNTNIPAMLTELYFKLGGGTPEMLADFVQKRERIALPMSGVLHSAERKADRIAAVLMARIGYDPRACIGSMSRDASDSSFTHPHPMERAEALMNSEAMRKALKIYETKKGLHERYRFHPFTPRKFLEMAKITV